jgi:hypothetical protein
MFTILLLFSGGTLVALQKSHVYTSSEQTSRSKFGVTEVIAVLKPFGKFRKIVSQRRYVHNVLNILPKKEIKASEVR